jgi:hypothetical protein
MDIKHTMWLVFRWPFYVFVIGWSIIIYGIFFGLAYGILLYIYIGLGFLLGVNLHFKQIGSDYVLDWWMYVGGSLVTIYFIYKYHFQKWREGKNRSTSQIVFYVSMTALLFIIALYILIIVIRG